MRLLYENAALLRREFVEKLGLSIGGSFVNVFGPLWKVFGRNAGLQ